MNLHHYLQEFELRWKEKRPFATVLLVNVRGSAPQEQGARMLVIPESELPVAGTIGGGKVEAKAIIHAHNLLRDTSAMKKDFVLWNLQRDVGMTCGGEVQLFFEVHFVGTWEVVVFGAGHVAQALIPLLLTLDCHVTCIDPRGEWLEKLPSSPRLKVVQVDRPHEAVEGLPREAFILSLTKGHASDFPVLKEVLGSRTPPYLGVIGSEAKAKVLRDELRRSGIMDERGEKFFCPIGLPIGNSTPAEMAVSIAAQLLQERDRWKERKL